MLLIYIIFFAENVFMLFLAEKILFIPAFCHVSYFVCSFVEIRC